MPSRARRRVQRRRPLTETTGLPRRTRWQGSAADYSWVPHFVLLVPLPPCPHAEHEAHFVGRLTLGAGKVRRAAKLALVDHARIRRELAAYLVAQAQSCIDI